MRLSLFGVLNELKEYDYKKYVVLKENDKTTINSIKNFNIEIIYQNGSGYGNALIEGINNCKTKFFCIFNADGSFNPKEIIQIMEKIEKIKLISFLHLDMKKKQEVKMTHL